MLPKSRKFLTAGVLVFAALAYSVVLAAQRSHESPGSARPAIPVVFEPNRGQSPSWVRYLARTSEGLVALAADRVEITRADRDAHVSFGLRFNGAHPRQFTEQAPNDGFANYYFGGASLHRVERVPLFRTIRYSQMYPGIDLAFHGREKRLEYDFEVAPNASTEPIQIDLNNDEQATLQDDGSLLITNQGRTMRLLAPQAFQSLDGTQKPVSVAYQLLDPHRFGFKLGAYDSSRVLVIDPVVAYAETVGVGNSTSVAAIAADADGSLIFTGSTFASNYIVVNGQPASSSASEEVYVTKFDPAGENIVYSTYLPAAGFSRATALALDGSGDAFIAGVTGDQSFPVTSHQVGACSPMFCNAGFVTKLDPSGALLYSTLLGSGQILPRALAIDPNRNAIVSGLAADGSLQTVNAFQAPYLGGLCTSCYSAFFAKLNATGTGFVFASYLGSGNIASGIALDSGGNIYIAGTADNVYGSTIPLKGELQSGGSSFFLDKFSPDGKTLLFGTYLGGYALTTSSSFAGLAIGKDGTVYMGGNTAADGFPYTLNAYRHPTGSPGNARMFALALNPSLTGLKYSTDLGDGYMNAMAIDASGNLYAAAQTGADPVQPFNAVVADKTTGGYLLELDPSGVPVQTSAFGGHDVDEVPAGIAVDASGNIFIAGSLGGGNPFPLASGPSDPILVGSNVYGQQSGTVTPGIATFGIFLAKVAPDTKPQISVSGNLPFIYLHNVGSADLNIISITFSGGLAKAGGTCGSKVPAGTTCVLTLTDANGKTTQGTYSIKSDASPDLQTFTPYLDPQSVGQPVGDYPYADISQLHFRPQFAGTKSPAQPMRIWNAGLTNMTLNSIRATPYLTETNDCPATLVPGAFCTVQVAWDTTSTYQSDMIGITYDNNPEAQDFLFGQYVANATALMLSQTNPLSFGNQTQGNPSLYRTITVTNVSNDPVNSPQVSISGDSVFSLAGNTCSASLAPQQSCVVGFSMGSAASVGQHTANLDFSGTLSASIEIGGVINLPQAITPSTYQMEWTPVLIGSSSTQDLTLTNTSSSSASLVTSLLLGTADYSETDNCTGTPLAAGASCTVHVTFKPQALGTRSDALNINLGTSMNPLLISLTGQGQYSLGLSPTVLDFGAGNLINTPSTPQKVTVLNETAASVAYSVVVTGPFSLGNQCANPIPANASCTIAVTYNPTAIESDTGVLTITAAGSTLTNSVSLFATSTNGSIMSVPSDLALPKTAVGDSSSSSITVSNTGKLSLSNVSFALSGGNAADFSVSANQCSTIPVGGSCTLTVSFSPSAAGPRYTSLTITSDASNSPRIIAITGVGMGFDVTFSAASLDFGKQDVGSQSAASTLTLTNTGNGIVTISSITSSSDFTETNNCGTTLPVSASCQISIQFAPSRTGPESGTITVVDAAGTQTIALSGSGTAPTLAVGPATGGSLTSTVTHGQAANYSLALTGTAGFNGTVSLTCSGAPQYATCTLSSSSIAVTPGSTKPFTVTVTTETTTTVSASAQPGLFAGIELLAMCLVIPRRFRNRFVHTIWFVLAVAAICTSSACGGGGGSHNTSPTANYTPAGTYQLTVTATSGSTTATETLVLTVQ